MTLRNQLGETPMTMFRTITLGAAIAASALMAAQVAGRPQTYSGKDNTAKNSGDGPASLGNPNGLRPDRDTRQSFQTYSQMLGYGRCSANVGKKSVAEALAAQPNSSTERRAFVQMQDRLRGCTAGNLNNILSLQRGSLAEGLYKKEAGSATLAPLAAGNPAYDKFIAGENSFNALLEADDQPMIAATNCLAAQQPDMAAKVLATTHGSAQEETAMNALFAAAPACAGATRPAGISRSFLRAFLSTSLQRFARYSSAKAG